MVKEKEVEEADDEFDDMEQEIPIDWNHILPEFKVTIDKAIDEWGKRNSFTIKANILSNAFLLAIAMVMMGYLSYHGKISSDALTGFIGLVLGYLAVKK